MVPYFLAVARQGSCYDEKVILGFLAPIIVAVTTVLGQVSRVRHPSRFSKSGLLRPTSPPQL
jgi:hypothetical protein